MLKKSAFVDEINNVLKLQQQTTNDSAIIETTNNVISYLQSRIEIIDKTYKK